MKSFRYLVSVCLALLVSTLAVRGATDFITYSSPQWSKAHPGYKKFEKLIQEEKWKQAADLLRKFDTSRDPYYSYETYADVFRHAGDVAAGLAQLEQRLSVLAQNPDILKNQHTTLLEQMRAAASYAGLWGRGSNLRSKLTIVNALTLYYSDDLVGAFAMAERIPKGELGADQKIELQTDLALRAWDMANKNADWPAAAAIAAYINDQNIYIYNRRENEIGLSCEKAGDFPLAQYYFEKSIDHCATEEERIQRGKTIAAFVRQHGLQGGHWLVKSILLHESGQTLAALELLGSKDHSSGSGYLKEILRPAFDQAYTKSDWATAAQVAAYTIWLTPSPDGEYLQHILEAIEKSGKPEAAIQFCLNSLWDQNPRSEKPHNCDLQGDPELVKRAAEIAQRHQLAPTDPLVSAWLLHLQGKSDEAWAQLETFLTEKDATKDLPFQSAVCRFLLGDIALAKDELRKALSWYYYASFWASLRLATDNSRGYYQPYDTHYHEVLGVTRQSRILVRMGKPDLAAEELAGLLRADPSIESTINLNTTLQTEWQQATALIEKARQQGVTVGAQFAEDLITSNGVPKPRGTSAKNITSLRKKLAATIAQAKREKAERTFAENQKRQAAELADKQKREAEEEATREAVLKFKLELARNEAARNYSYQDELNAGKKANSRRRCASCLGSGKAGYVTGSKFQSSTTGQEVAAPPCSSCNGTGWR